MTGSGRDAAVFAAARPRVVGSLVRQFRDLELAEDAYQTACLRAVRLWPERGRPRDPTAWLLVVARNAGRDALRRTRRLSRLADDLPADDAPGELELVERLDAEVYRDDVLRLFFLCCQPPLRREDQLALALKVVAGLSVAQIARAFLVRERAMEQRLTRAKRRLAAAGVPFEVPTAAERAGRLNAVATMLYLMFNEGYTCEGTAASDRAPLCDEAIRLTRLLLRLFPGQSEVLGLLALFLFQHARRRARLDRDGAIVLLENQDRTIWDREMIAEAGVLLEKALRKGGVGTYQIQAAIAGVHCAAADFESTDWAEIERLYAALEQVAPSPVVTLNHAVAIARTRSPQSALALIEPLAGELQHYLYFHGAHAALLEQCGRRDEACLAYRRALALCTTSAQSAHLRDRLAALGQV